MTSWATFASASADHEKHGAGQDHPDDQKTGDADSYSTYNDSVSLDKISNFFVTAVHVGVSVSWVLQAGMQPLFLHAARLWYLVVLVEMGVL